MILPHIPGLIGLISNCCFSLICLFIAMATRERWVTFKQLETILMSLALLVSFTVCCAQWSNYHAKGCHMNSPLYCLGRTRLLLGWCLVSNQIRCLWVFLAQFGINRFFYFSHIFWVVELIFLVGYSQGSVVNWALRVWQDRKGSSVQEAHQEKLDQWASRGNQACLELQERLVYLWVSFTHAKH